MVDMATFGLPLAGSVNQLLIIWGKSNAGGNPGLISFSVLFIFLHFVSHLAILVVLQIRIFMRLK